MQLVFHKFIVFVINLVMGYVFYDIFSIINVSFMGLKLYHGHH